MHYVGRLPQDDRIPREWRLIVCLDHETPDPDYHIYASFHSVSASSSEVSASLEASA